MDLGSVFARLRPFKPPQERRKKKIQYPAGRSRANLHRSTNEAGKLEDLSAVSEAFGRSRVFSSEGQESDFRRCYLDSSLLVLVVRSNATSSESRSR